MLVEADRTQLEQVIANLAVNARDAMPDGGRLVIEVSLPVTAGREAVLAVSDNGSGMDAETAAHVFEPFFSTKGAGGSGFGLATVHGIVSQSGGRIVLDSTPGDGSTFSIFLPLSEGVADAAAARARRRRGRRGHDPRRRGRRQRSHDRDQDAREPRLSASSRPTEARQPSSSRPTGRRRSTSSSPTSRCPASSGRETAERVRGLFPAAKVLFMSGYTDDLVIRGGAFEPGISFIQKPFGAASSRDACARFSILYQARKAGHAMIVTTTIAIARTRQTTDHATTQNQPSDIFIA